ncbi:MAG: hypothetical protein INQ03_03745 [Candidatus Heimdallarchaeota archaeon]|nr:hypothetical protein [Candidatus Heimdallarchaeota archaeon]
MLSKLFTYWGNYYSWANNKFREVIGNINDDQFTLLDEDVGKSLKELVIHQIVTCELLLRSQEEIEPMIKNLHAMAKAELMEFWRKSDDAFAEKIHTDFEGVVNMPVSETQKIEVQKTEMLFAYTDHSTFHRGQMLTMIKKLGQDAVNTDFYSYLLVKYM